MQADTWITSTWSFLRHLVCQPAAAGDTLVPQNTLVNQSEAQKNRCIDVNMSP